MSTFAERFNYALKSKNISAADISRLLKIPEATLSQYKSGKYEPKQRRLEQLAQVLNVSVQWLMGYDSPMFEPIDKDIVLIPIPIIASVSAGYDGLAVIEADGVELMPSSELHGYSAAELRIFNVKGDSMYPRILDGDKVLVHLQSSVDSGDIAVVVYNGDEATVKRVRYAPGEDWMELIPANPEYKTKRIEGKELEHCHVVGKIIKLIRDF